MHWMHFAYLHINVIELDFFLHFIDKFADIVNNGKLFFVKTGLNLCDGVKFGFNQL